jgi:hypothetical protein
MLNHKRIMSLVLAGAMAASLAVPAFAAEDDSEDPDASLTTNRSTAVTANYQDVKIEVVVPKTATVVINPYALPTAVAKASAGDDAADVKISGQQIVTWPMAIKNRSEVALDVNATATATLTGNLTLGTTPTISSTETKNVAFIYMAMAPSGLSGAVGSSTDQYALAAEYKTLMETKATEDDPTAGWPAYDSKSTAQAALVSGKAVTATKMITLAQPTLDEDTGEFTEYAVGSIAYFGLSGTCIESPKTAWTTKDGVKVAVSFTFTPNTNAAEEESED